ncbi:MAG: RidA family protein [Sphingomonadales bacterium]|nr:RidA family protein [Sphingomonadales bacterium]
MSIELKLAELGHKLPEPAAPIAAYVPAVHQGGMLYISGQLPFINGQVVTGKVGDFANPLGRTMEDGKIAAQACALMLIAQMKAALGDLNRVERIVKLGVFVASTSDFTNQPIVANGASDLMEAVFGEAGKHARSAVSVPVLPLDATVEIDAIVAVKGK